MSKWQRIKYLPVSPLGKGGAMVTGSKAHIDLSRSAAAEGMVLLKNENNTLPLKPGAAVALFGKASADYVKGGGGSGDVTVAYIRNICDGMEEKQVQGKLTSYQPLHDFYRAEVARQFAEGKQPGYTVEPEIPEELLSGAAAECDTAIISICRFSGEDYDRKGEPGDGDFYLSPQEGRMVEQVTDRFDKIIVILNVGGMVDTSWFFRNPKIQAVLLGWQGGMEGGLAQADILCGDVCPSGKLVDTFAASFDDYPSSYNFNESDDYVCYTDDIFVGYRYFETIPGAAQKVNYPFGFGLSYTTFSIRCTDIRRNKRGMEVDISVSNTGSVAGKEVVQLYSSVSGSRLEMPALELRAFRKTRLLQPGETQELTLELGFRDLASYDEASASWVLTAGTYSLHVGNSVRDLEKICWFRAGSDITISKLQNRCVPIQLPRRLKADGTYEELPMQEPTVLPAHEDWPAKPDIEHEHILPNTNGQNVAAGRFGFTKVASGEATLDEFLAQLTEDELITLLGGCTNRGCADTRGMGDLPHLEVPAAMTADGPAGLRIREDRGVCTTAWPIATLLACTWNEDLVCAVGEAGGLEVKEHNYAMWLTPAINIHRSPLCGRNFEYYSEDPLVAGKLAAAMVRGIQSNNIAACAKHFCVNNKETNRKASDSRLSERALREIYIKAFQIVVAESDPWAIMTAYNLLNGTYTSESYDLLTGILRQEWGYKGMVTTDWENYAEQYRELKAGNNVRMPTGSFRRLQKAREENLITREDLENNARKVLEYLLRLD